MCTTLHASEMSGTRLYAGEATRSGTYVHVMGYQNKAKNLSAGPNAMILPIPTASKLGPENAIDTRKFSGFLDDIAEATKTPTFRRGRSRSMDVDSLEDTQVFDVGSYTVSLGTKMGAAMAGLDRVPDHKRPDMNPLVVASLAGLYPGWAFAICCWDGKIEAEPLLWWYEPKVPSFLFAPALDAHDGEAPSKKDVLVDHIVTFGSTLKSTGMMPIRYVDKIPADVADLLPTKAVGQKLQRMMPNGDFWYPTQHFGVGVDPYPQPALRFFPGPEGADLKQATTVPLGRWT